MQGRKRPQALAGGTPVDACRIGHPMNDNTAPRNDDDTPGMKLARHISWIVIAALGLGFIVYTALFQ